MPARAKDALRELIDDGHVHVMDGAMGTELYASGVFVNVSYDGLNLETPDIVESVHRSYVNAGAEVIETNTFGANPVKLSSYGLADRTEEVNRAGVRTWHAGQPDVRSLGGRGHRALGHPNRAARTHLP